MKKTLLTLAAAACALCASADLYVVGAFEGGSWDLPGNTVTGTDNVYTLELPGATIFKMSTVEATDWDAFNAAALQCAAPLTDAGEMALEVGEGNIVLPWKGDWTVVVDLSNPEAPKATFSTDTEKPTGPLDIYLRGGMNGWGVDDAYKFAANEDGTVYTLTGIDIEAGTEFKVGDDSWGNINYGGGVIVLGEETPLDYNGSNLSCEEDIVNGTFTLVIDEGEFLLTVENASSAINEIANDNAPAVYYNLQGVRVANPANGLFIVKRGNTVSKVIM